MRKVWLRLALGALATVIAIGALVVVIDQATSPAPAAPSGIAPPIATPVRTTPAALESTAVLGATPPPAAAPVRLIIASIGVDAPLTVKGLDAQGNMELPDGPEDVAWYGFSARPGQEGNVVLSGHLDYHDYGPAVFARLGDLKPGELVELQTTDGAISRYGVTLAVTYETASAPADEIVGPTSRDTVTLITCDGRFDRTTRQYSHRLVVRAERL
jgi:LPXTG-site transpeptidase (sortase) family protein